MSSGSWFDSVGKRLRRLVGREEEEKRRVAIACQGGGSHTAFTAGALGHLLEHLPDSHRIVGLSGTSGGAVCATTAWYALVSERDPGTLLDAVWEEIAATERGERWLNEWLVAGARLEDSGLGVPSVSPYDTALSDRGRRRLGQALSEHVAFEEFSSLFAGASDPPRLAIGAAAVETGAFEVFENASVTCEAVLASAAVPELFEAVTIDGRAYWDGLFSQNPPILDLVIGDEERIESPDELWVIQINPRVYPTEPTALADIRQRANELTGNVSLQQQLRVVRQLNRWAANDGLQAREYTHTEIEVLELPRSAVPPTKLDRSAHLIDDLEARGRERAAAFLDHKRRSGTTRRRE